MINNKDEILKWVNDSLPEDHFLVEMIITPSNHIYIEVDADKGVSLSYCVELSRLIDSKIDREKTDFELEVASSTLGHPFKVYRQYIKNIGREIEVVTKLGLKEIGILKDVSETLIILEISRKLKFEGKKRKEEVLEEVILRFNEIKEAKNIIRFK